MKYTYFKAALTIIPIALLITGLYGSFTPHKALAATGKTDPGYQKIFDEQICVGLQKIKNPKYLGICKDYIKQKDLTSAYNKICGKYGAKGTKQLKKECDAYKNYKKGSFKPVSATNTPCGKDYCPDEAASKHCDQDACDLISLYLNPAISLLSAIVGVVVVASIIVGGIQYSSSEGDPQKAAKAKARISSAIFALIAYLFLFAFLQFLVPGGVFNR